MVIVDGYQYEVIENVKEGFKEEDFLARYTEILSRYDYIVGDWGYGQLRLKGFFDDKNQKATFDTKFSTFEDYLYEYCNFGCAYFILKKGEKAQVEQVKIEEQENANEVKAPKEVQGQRIDQPLEQVELTSETDQKEEIQA